MRNPSWVATFGSKRQRHLRSHGSFFRCRSPSLQGLADEWQGRRVLNTASSCCTSVIRRQLHSSGYASTRGVCSNAWVLCGTSKHNIWRLLGDVQPVRIPRRARDSAHLACGPTESWALVGRSSLSAGSGPFYSAGAREIWLLARVGCGPMESDSTLCQVCPSDLQHQQRPLRGGSQQAQLQTSVGECPAVHHSRSIFRRAQLGIRKKHLVALPTSRWAALGAGRLMEYLARQGHWCHPRKLHHADHQRRQASADEQNAQA